MREETRFLDHPSDRPSQQDRVPRSCAATVDVDFTVRGCEQTVDELQSCCFTRTASSEQDQSFAGESREADVLEQNLIRDPVVNFTELDD